MLNITVPAHATGLPEGRLLGRDLSSATLLSTAQLLDLLGGRETVEATVEGLIGLLDDTDAPGEDREPVSAGFFGPGDDREDEDEHGTDLDHGEADHADDEPYFSVVEWNGHGDNWRRSGQPTDIEEVNEDGDIGRDPHWWGRSAHPVTEADHV